MNTMSNNAAGNNNNTMVKKMEDMKMATTVLGRIKAFNAWVDTQIQLSETFLNIDINTLESWWLGRQELINEDIFNKKFQYHYSRINEAVEETKWKAKDANIPNDVLEDALNRFKEMKSKVRKTKLVYKQAFDELREAILAAKDSTGHVEETADLIQELVVQWRDTHEIIFHLKDQFVGEGLRHTVKNLTDWLLSTRLYPREDDIKEFVDNYMKHRTVRAA